MSCQLGDMRVATRRRWLGPLKTALLLTLFAAPAGAALADDYDLFTCPPMDPAVDPAALSAAVEAARGGEKGAGELILAMLAEHPDSAHLQHDAAVALLTQGDGIQALTHAREAVEAMPGCGPAQRVLGRSLEAAGKGEEALKAYALALTIDPDDGFVHERLAAVYLGASRLDDAEPHLRWIKDRYEGDAESQARWAEVQGWRGQSADAVAGFGRARAIDASVMTTARWRTLGDAAFETGAFDVAASAYETTLSRLGAKDGDRVAVLQQLGFSYMRLGRYADAAKVFGQARDLTPEDWGVHANLARALHADGRTKEAMPAYIRAVDLNPKDDALRVEAAGVISSIETERAASIALLRPLVSRDPVDPTYGLMLAEIMSWSPEHRGEALGILERVEKVDPDSAELWRITRQTVLWSTPSADLIPMHERLQGHYPQDLDVLEHRAYCLSKDPRRVDEAMATLSRIKSLDASRMHVRLALAELQAQIGGADHAALVQELGFLSQELKTDADAQGRLGVALQVIGEPSAALSTFDRCLSIDGQSLRCLVGRAEALEALKRDEEATAAIKKARAQSPSGAYLRELNAMEVRISQRQAVQQAEALEAAGKKDEAITARSALAKANPTDPDSWVALGAAQARAEKWDSALASFDKALALDGAHVGALKGRSGVLVALGRYGDAEKTLQKELAVAPTDDARRRLETVHLTQELSKAQAELSGGSVDVAIQALGAMYGKHPDDAAVAALYAEALAKAKRYSEAASAWERALKLTPNDARVLRGAATTFWVVGPRERARDLLSQAREASPETELVEIDRILLSWTLDLAEEAKKTGDIRKALVHYGQAYELAPSTDYVLNGIAGLYWANGQLDLASKYYARCLALHPENTDAAYGVGETLMLRGLPEVAYRLVADTPAARTDARVKDVVRRAGLQRDLNSVEAAWERGEKAVALSLAEDLSRRFPNEPQPWHLLGRLATREGQYLDALHYYRKALAIAPDSEADLYGTIATLQALGQHAEAAHLIGQARARGGSDDRARELDYLEAAGWVARGEVLKGRGEMESAFAAYLRAVELAPDAPWVLCGMGGLYASRAQYDEAIFIFGRALELDPRNRLALAGLASSHIAAGNAQQAEGYLGQLRELEGSSRRVRFLDAEQAVASRDYDLAVDIYEDLLQEDPQDPRASRGLVLAYLKSGQAGVSLAVAADELPAQFDDKEFLKLSAAALRGVSRTDMAVPVYRRIAVTWPSPEANSDLESAILGAYIEAAETARDRGDAKEAQGLYEEALRRAPDNPELLDALGGAEIDQGNYYEAMEYFERALDSDPEGTWAVIGYANASAATGDSREALRVLGRAWDDTEDPWVGLHRARLLIDAGRYGEADRQLRQVEDVLEEERRIAANAAELARQNGRYINDMAAAERFWSRWVALASEPVEPHPLEVHDPLPPLPRSQLMAAKKEAAPAAASEGAQSDKLKDVDATLSMPERAVDLPPPTKTAPGTVNLTELDQLLMDLRAAEENRMEEERRAQAQKERERRQDPDRPALSFDDTQGPAEAPQGSVYVPTNVVFEVASAEPYQPRSSHRSPGPRDDRIAREPVEELSRLDRELKKKTASFFSMGVGIDARTGTPGTTALVAAMFDARVQANLRPSFGIYGYGTPVVATNIVESQEGVMVGAGLTAAPGPFYLGAELGTSPIGFLGGTQGVGFVRLGTDAIPRFGIGVEVARETINDSLLSWAGLTDDETGLLFGRVARTRGSLNLRIGLDPRAMLLLGGDVGRYDGLRVDPNSWWQGRAGLRFRVWSEGDERVFAGAEGYAMQFEKQLDTFSPSDGGYFSPELFVTARGRVGYEGRVMDDQLDLEAWGALGVQYTVGEATPNLTPGLRPAVALHVGAEYMLDLGLSLGLRYDFDNAGGVYTRNVGWLFLKKRFGVRG